MKFNKKQKKRISEINKLLKKPPEEAVKLLKKYKVCPTCGYVKDTKICPKCSLQMKKITESFYKCKALLKIFLELGIITKDEVCNLRLTTLCWSYKS